MLVGEVVGELVVGRQSAATGLPRGCVRQVCAGIGYRSWGHLAWIDEDDTAVVQAGTLVAEILIPAIGLSDDHAMVLTHEGQVKLW